MGKRFNTFKYRLHRAKYLLRKSFTLGGIIYSMLNGLVALCLLTLLLNMILISLWGGL